MYKNFHLHALPISGMILALALTTVACNHQQMQVTPTAESSSAPKSKDGACAAANTPLGYMLDDVLVRPNNPDPLFQEPIDTVSALCDYTAVRKVILDRRGRYWLAAATGLLRYDGGQFVNETLKRGWPHHRVMDLLEDSKGRIWVATSGDGLYCLDGDNMKRYAQSDGLSDNSINSLMEDRNGRLWIGSANGLNCFDGLNFTCFSARDGLRGQSISSIIQDQNGSILLGYFDAYGLTRYDGKTFSNFPLPQSITHENGNSLMQDQKGGIWFSANQGLIRFDADQPVNITQKFHIKYTTVSCQMEDRAGRIWLGVRAGKKGGVYCIDGSNIRFFPAEEGLINAYIYRIVEDQTGAIWVCTQNGVCRFDGQKFINLSSTQKPLYQLDDC